MKRFGVMLDMSRDAVMKKDEVIKFCKTIKSFGYNMIMLYTEDTYQVENEPYFGYMRGRYTFDEQKYIVDECQKMGVEVIPCIQTLAHLNQIFRWHDYCSVCDTGDILLAGCDRCYQLIENMIKTLRKAYTTNYIHIGMDEATMFGLGEYLKINGYKNRYEELIKHLNKVIAICEKYNFKPIMWSDMFFKLSNNGEYYPENPVISEEVVKITPENLDLAYWDYYHVSKDFYDKMITAHQKFKNPIWFAGGAWTWSGFAPNNYYTLNTMQPAMASAKEHNIENIIITMWGDNGKECSFYSALPSLFAVKKLYDGITDIDKIKGEFHNVTGEDFDDMMSLDDVNLSDKNANNVVNPSKYMLYNDIFAGVFDSLVQGDEKEKYISISNHLRECGKRSKNYKYIFDYIASLSDVLQLKYDFGVRLRKEYKAKNVNNLKKLSDEIIEIVARLREFYNNFSNLWYRENKPFGFEIHDVRLGGLIQRLTACKQRLDDFINGKTEEIQELECEILPYKDDTYSEKNKMPYCNTWFASFTTNVI